MGYIYYFLMVISYHRYYSCKRIFQAKKGGKEGDCCFDLFKFISKAIHFFKEKSVFGLYIWIRTHQSFVLFLIIYFIFKMAATVIHDIPYYPDRTLYLRFTSFKDRDLMWFAIAILLFPFWINKFRAGLFYNSRMRIVIINWNYIDRWRI